MALTIDVSTTQAIKRAYSQLQTQFEDVYKPQIACLVSRPRSTSTLERHQIETRKLFDKLEREIIKISAMLRTELQRRRSSATRRPVTEARRLAQERTQTAADRLDGEIEDYLRMMENALDNTSGAETLVNSSDDEEEHQLPVQCRDALSRTQVRPDQHGTPRALRRTVRFPRNGTPIMPTAAQLERSISRSRPRSPPAPWEHNTRDAGEPLTSTLKSQHRADQSRMREPVSSRPGDGRHVLIPQQPMAVPSTRLWHQQITTLHCRVTTTLRLMVEALRWPITLLITPPSTTTAREVPTLVPIPTMLLQHTPTKVKVFIRHTHPPLPPHTLITSNALLLIGRWSIPSTSPLWRKDLSSQAQSTPRRLKDRHDSHLSKDSEIYSQSRFPTRAFNVLHKPRETITVQR